MWICLPDDDHYAIDKATCIPNPDWGEELDDRGGGSFLPESVLAQGPDVMFEGSFDFTPTPPSTCNSISNPYPYTYLNSDLNLY